MSKVILMVALAAAFTMAQQTCNAAPTAAKTQDQPAAEAQPGQSPSTSEQPEAEKETKKSKKEKKKKEKDGGDDARDTSVFSDRAANDVLGQIRDGLEGHSRRLLLSAFDADKMDGFLQFEDQIDAMFQRYEGFRVHYRIAQTQVEGDRGVVLVDMTLEEIPRGGSAPPVRKREQVRFELERGRKGWKVVDFRPRGFFS